MNWRAVRTHNAQASARKAERERREASHKARIEREGGPIKVAELQAASRRLEKPVSSWQVNPYEVWTFRGQDWLIGISDGPGITNAFPFRPWRSGACDPREYVPLTIGATRWVESQRAANT